MEPGGPGATNLLTGIATAWTDSTPVIVFTGQQSLNYLGKGAFQEIDHVAIFSPITKWSTMLIKPERTLEILREAFKAATWGRPGPVHIDLPLDVQNKHVNFNEEKDFRRITDILSPPNSCGDSHAINRALKLLVESSRPVIIAGGGLHYSSRACKELKELAEYLDIPVATTFNGRGSFPEDHPLSVGRMGVHASSFNDRILAEADLILAIGCRFAALSTRSWSNINPAAKLIHVDIDPGVLEKNYPVEVGIIGDAKKVLKKLLEKAKELEDPGKERRKKRLNFIEQAKDEWKRSPWFTNKASKSLY